jgi:RNA polymerase sigma-70 factor (ECF subfamily)
MLRTGSRASAMQSGAMSLEAASNEKNTPRTVGRFSAELPQEPPLSSDENPWTSDQELVEQILKGDRKAFELLYDTYFRRVYLFALRRLKDSGEAEDVTQEVFMTVMKALASYQGTSSLLVWMFGIARNKVNRRFRGPRLRLESMNEAFGAETASDQPATDRAVEARRMLDRCEAVIENELTPLQRRIFHLKHLRRESIRSIATALGKSEDAIKANLYRMRRALSEGVPGLDSVVSP